MSQYQHFTDYVRVLYKRRWLAAAAFLLVFAYGATTSLRKTPIYEAGTQLLIEKDSRRAGSPVSTSTPGRRPRNVSSLSITIPSAPHRPAAPAGPAYSICRSSHDSTSSSIATSVPVLALNAGTV